MNLDQKNNNKTVYTSIIENLSIPNFIELVSYIGDESSDLSKKIYDTVTLLIKQIDSNDKETWKKILKLLKINNKENYQTNIEKIKDIVLSFDETKKEKLISIFIEIAKEKRRSYQNH